MLSVWHTTYHIIQYLLFIIDYIALDQKFHPKKCWIACHSIFSSTNFLEGILTLCPLYPQQTWDPSIRSLLQPHPCPYDGVNYVFQNAVYIFAYLKFSVNCITWFNWKYILFEWPFSLVLSVRSRKQIKV